MFDVAMAVQVEGQELDVRGFAVFVVVRGEVSELSVCLLKFKVRQCIPSSAASRSPSLCSTAVITLAVFHVYFFELYSQKIKDHICSISQE
jgi:hypothetical protein